MKKILIVLFAFNCIGIQAQEKKVYHFKRNEIKGNALLLVLGAGEVGYERLLNKESGVGASLFMAYDRKIHQKFSFSPYYREYFGRKAAAGFFVEGFGMLNTNRIHGGYHNYYDATGTLVSEYHDSKRITDFALGFGLGGKWLTKRGFLFEINTGLGRNLFQHYYHQDKFVGKGGLTVGYRF